MNLNALFNDQIEEVKKNLKDSQESNQFLFKSIKIAILKLVDMFDDIDKRLKILDKRICALENKERRLTGIKK